VKKYAAQKDILKFHQMKSNVLDVKQSTAINYAQYAMLKYQYPHFRKKAFFQNLVNNLKIIKMAAQKIGRVKSGKGKSYEVKWDSISKDTYVSYAGWTFVGKAISASDAMRKAEASVYNK